LTTVTVTPQSFSMVAFDAGRIAALAVEVAEGVGLPPGVELHVEIDEGSPFGNTRTTISDRRVELHVDGGAFENPKHVRHLSETGTRLVLGRLLFRALDRLDPAFGGAPPDDDLTMAQHSAWDAYAVGRYARLAGIDGGQARRRYAFRLRHGFTDVSDRVFDRLWGGSGLSWADLEAACRETQAGTGDEPGRAASPAE
jgi:hypothetical protein